MHHRVQVLGLGHPVASFPKFYAPFRRAGCQNANETASGTRRRVFGLVKLVPSYKMNHPFSTSTYLHGAVACAKYAVDGTVNALVSGSNTKASPAVRTKRASNVSRNVW